MFGTKVEQEIQRQIRRWDVQEAILPAPPFEMAILITAKLLIDQMDKMHKHYQMYVGNINWNFKLIEYRLARFD